MEAHVKCQVCGRTLTGAFSWLAIGPVCRKHRAEALQPPLIEGLHEIHHAGPSDSAPKVDLEAMINGMIDELSTVLEWEVKGKGFTEHERLDGLNDSGQSK